MCRTPLRKILATPSCDSHKSPVLIPLNSTHFEGIQESGCGGIYIEEGDRAWRLEHEMYFIRFQLGSNLVPALSGPLRLRPINGSGLEAQGGTLESMYRIHSTPSSLCP